MWLPFPHSQVAYQGKTEEEAKKNIAEAIELHLSALARDGMHIGHRKGSKETFVAVDL